MLASRPGEGGDDAHKTQPTAGVAHLHIASMFVTLDTSHCDTSPLNDLAPWTAGGDFVRESMHAQSQATAGVAHLHMATMSVTLDTFHCDTSPLNELASLTVAEVKGPGYGGEGGSDAHTPQATAGVAHLHIEFMSVTLDTSHSDTLQLNEVASRTVAVG